MPWGTVHAAAGDPDLTFGNQGEVRLDLFPNAYPGIGDLVGAGVAVQPDGKVVVSGGSLSGRSVVARYLADGRPDPEFNGDGIVVLSIYSMYSMALQPDGKILICGSSAEDFTLARLLPDGSADPDFAGGRILVDDVSGGTDVAICLVLQPDGKIVVTGRAVKNGIDSFVTVRYLANGERDLGFADAGVSKVTLGGPQSQPRGLAIQTDGKILITGYGGLGFAVVRLMGDGSMDTGFGVSGKVVMPTGQKFGVGNAIGVQADGKILVAGATAGNATGSLQGSGATNGTLWRFSPNGNLDSGFGTGGMVKTAFSGYDSDFRAFLIEGDGKVLLAGSFMPRLGSGFGGNGKSGVARYLSDGELDTSFGDGGFTAYGEDGRLEYASALGVQLDGKIVITGSRHNGSRNVISTRRFQPNGVITGFGGLGKTGAFTGVPGSNDVVCGAALAPDGKIVVAGTVWVGAREGGTSVGQDFVVARWNPDGALDRGFSGDGIQTRSIATGFSNDKALALAVQADGMVLVTGSSASSRDTSATRGAVVRFRTDGSTDTYFGNYGTLKELTVSSAIAVQPNGRIITGSYGRISRYRDDGWPDPTFGTSGTVTFPSNYGTTVALVVQPDGGILAGYYSSARSFLTRFTSSGAKDIGFGGDGEVTFQYPGHSTILKKFALQPDGRIVACGWMHQEGSIKSVLARYHSDGSLDQTFGIGGWVVNQSLPGRNEASSVAIQSDGKIVTGGSVDFSESFERAVIVRYLPDGTPDTGFNGLGYLTYTERLTVVSIVLQANGAIIAAA